MATQRTPSVLTALDAALKAAQPGDVDAATVALAKRYAAQLDEAQALSDEAAALLEEALADEEGAKFLARVAKLQAKVDATAAAALIGPKLLDALTQLQLTPAARRAVVPPGGGGNGDGGGSALGHLRALGSNRAKAVDSPAS